MRAYHQQHHNAISLGVKGGRWHITQQPNRYGSHNQEPHKLQSVFNISINGQVNDARSIQLLIYVEPLKHRESNGL